MSYPGPWYYDEDNGWITRDTNDEGDGEIWCEFKRPPNEDELDLLLEWLNDPYRDKRG